MELLQNLYLIGEYSLFNRIIITVAFAMFFIVVFSWIVLIINVIVANKREESIAKKKEKYETMIFQSPGNQKPSLFGLNKADFPLLMEVLVKHRDELRMNNNIKTMLEEQGVISYYMGNLKSSNWRLRLEAARYLGELGYPEFFEPLKPLIDDKYSYVADEAMLAISLLDSEKPARFMLDYMEANYNHNMRWIDMMLQNIAKHDMIFVSKLDSKNLAFRYRMLDIIRYMHRYEYIPYIIELANKPGVDDESVIKTIFIAAMKPGTETETFLLGKSAIQNQDVKKFANIALAKLRSVQQGNQTNFIKAI